MNKLDMATQILLKLIETNERGYDPEGIAGYAWEIADAMEAEAEKRIKATAEKNAEESKVFFEKLSRVETQDKFISAINEGVRKAEELEWQPDWSVAPDGYDWWAMDGFSEKANWYIDKPYLDDDSEVESEWNIDLRTDAKTYIQAPTFNYQGDWKDSLRKRP